MNFHKLALFTTVLAIIVIILGAYTRLSDAGLGCPDWPGCYGQIDVPTTDKEISKAEQSFPDRPVEEDKAWKEMIHRYAAGSLGLAILALCIVAWKNKRDPEQPLILPTILVGIVIFQALLGMWTVTLLLKPLVVVVHLLFGFTTLAILFWLTLKSGRYFKTHEPTPFKQYRIPALIGGLILIMQIALGGWTSSNYAALVCPDLPTCQASWWPAMNFKDAFVLWRGVGIDYEGGVLTLQARTAIHVTHRIGAIVTFLYLLILGIMIIRTTLEQSVLGQGMNIGQGMKLAGMLLVGIVIVQVSLGLANVFFNLPLYVAVAHNAVAALLLLSVIFLHYLLYIKD